VTLIPFTVGPNSYNVFVALEDKNLTRMKAYDPAQFKLDKFPPEFATKRLDTVIIGYVTDKDLKQVHFLIESGAPAAALEFLSRGFKFQPEKGDSDEPYKKL
jgi:hypothetical protein